MSNLNILVVDDDEDQREILEVKLTKSGFNVDTAENGKRGLDILSTKPFGAIIVDKNMPEMDGLTLCSHIKTNIYNYKTPVFFVSGDINPQEQKRLGRMGIARLIEKPIDFNQLTSELKNLTRPPAKPTGYSDTVKEIFQGAMEETFRFYFDDFHVGTPYVVNDQRTLAEINSSVTFFGDTFYGSVSLSFYHSFFRSFSKVLFSQDDIPLEYPFLKDLAGELGNQVAGIVKNKLFDLGVYVQIGLPFKQVGQHTIPYHVSNDRQCFPCRCGEYEIFLEFSLGTPINVGKVDKEIELFYWEVDG